MSTVEKISIALPAEMVSSIRQAVDDGDYSSSSEVIRDALRDWTLKRTLRQQGVEGLRRLWQEARLNAAPGEPADKVLDSLELKYQALADQAK